MTFSRRKKNLSISDSTVNYEVSRKDCGKLALCAIGRYRMEKIEVKTWK